MLSRRFVLYLFAVTCLFPRPLYAQRKIAVPILKRLSQQAGYIFSGTVLSVERLQPKVPNDVAAVRITFRVDQAAKGVTAKQTFSIREWAGLWDHNERYRPGQHVLLFLYRSSKLGLTSPVGGDYGRYELDNSGRILGNPSRLEELQLKPPLSTSKKPVVNTRNLIRTLQRQGGE